MSVITARCLTSGTSCDYHISCAKGTGIGASGGATFVAGFIFGATCADELEEFSLGPDFDLGAGPYGSAGAQVGASSFSIGVEGGAGSGGSGTASACWAARLGCH